MCGPHCRPTQANLPLLQRELLHCAHLAKQTPAQYLAQHEETLLDTSTTSPGDSSELLLEVNENGKRRTPDRYCPPPGQSSPMEGLSDHHRHLCIPRHLCCPAGDQATVQADGLKILTPQEPLGLSTEARPPVARLRPSTCHRGAVPSLPVLP